LSINPTLHIIAGCNGAGKSTFSKELLSNQVDVFDFDLEKQRIYQSLSASDIRDTMEK